MPPLEATLRATGPATAVSLAAKALLRFVLARKSGVNELTWHLGSNRPLLVVLMIARTAVEVISDVVITRIQVNLLPADAKTVIPIDEALRTEGKNGGNQAIGMKEAWQTFGWRAWWRLGVTYVQIFLVILIGGGLILVVNIFLFVSFLFFASLVEAGKKKS
jgi:hypothetical protein